MAVYDGVNGTVCNATQFDQSQQFYNKSSPLSKSPLITCLTHGDTIGLALTAEASFISCTCIIVIFIRIYRNVRWWSREDPTGDWKLFQAPADIYMVALFVFDFLQAMGGALDVRWAHIGIVTRGNYCIAQGIVQQTGELGVALMTLLLALHTFVACMWSVGLKARGVALGLICIACIFIVLWVSIGASTHGNYEAPTPYWCWISPQFLGERLGGEYIWLWVAFASVTLYIPLHFWMDSPVKTGTLTRDQSVDYKQRRAAFGMLLYPLAYSIVVLPTSVTRWLTFNPHHVSKVPSAATFFGAILFNLSGALNVVLFLTVRSERLLFQRPRPDELGGSDMELAPQGGRSADTTGLQHSSEPTTTALPDEDFKNSTLSRAGSRRRISEETI